MTVTANRSASAAEQIGDRLRAMFAEGLPQGDISFSSKNSVVYLWVPTKAEVSTWAAVMGCTARLCIETYSTGRQETAELPGWQLDVWCFADEVIKPDPGLGRWLDSVSA